MIRFNTLVKVRVDTILRTKAMTRRKVQLCQSKQILDLVKDILDAFEAGKKDVTEF